jgi:hypothetical protein
MKVIEEHGIASKVSYFMMGNAKNNETMLKSLSLCKLLYLVVPGYELLVYF